MENNQILVLVASEESATLCVSYDGVSELAARYPSAGPRVCDPKIASLVDRRRPLRALAAEIMADLRRCAMTGAYDGIVICAPFEMMKELHLAMDCKVCKLLIAALLQAPRNSGHGGVHVADIFRGREAARRAAP